MDLYQLKGEALSPLSSQEFSAERELQKVVEGNLDALFGLSLVSSEYSLGEFRIDTLAFDDENDAFVIIEYKKGQNYSVIDQGFSYLSHMLENKAEFYLEFSKQRKKSLEREKINWGSSRDIFISPSFNRYQRNSVNFRDIPFELWEIRRFSGGIISFDQVQVTSKESINSIASNRGDSVIRQVSSEVTVFQEDDHASKLSPSFREVWNGLKEKFDEWPDVTLIAKNTMWV